MPEYLYRMIKTLFWYRFRIFCNKGPYIISLAIRKGTLEFRFERDLTEDDFEILDFNRSPPDAARKWLSCTVQLNDTGELADFILIFN